MTNTDDTDTGDTDLDDTDTGDTDLDDTDTDDTDPDHTDTGDTDTDDAIERILSLDTIAVVGCSTTSGKAAHDVPAYLQDHGYRIVPVNPFADEVLGERAYDSLEVVEEHVDVVDVFRPSEEVPGIVDEALAREDVAAVWLQQGITDDAAMERVRAADRLAVQDRCLKVEHGRRR